MDLSPIRRLYPLQQGRIADQVIYPQPVQALDLSRPKCILRLNGAIGRIFMFKPISSVEGGCT